MNIFKKYKNFKAERKAAVDNAARFEGFGWAMAAFYLDGQTLADIEAKCLYPFDRTAFDDGACDALIIMSRLQRLSEREMAEVDPVESFGASLSGGVLKQRIGLTRAMRLHGGGCQPAPDYAYSKSSYQSQSGKIRPLPPKED